MSMTRAEAFQELKEKLQEIEQQLKMYEDDKAEELLNQLIEWLEREE